MGIKKKDIDRDYREFIEFYLPKIIERGTLILLSIKDKTEIREDDMDVLEFFYKSYYNGELSQLMPDINSLNKEQDKTEVPSVDLFNANVTVEAPMAEPGMDVDYPPIETKKEKK